MTDFCVVSFSGLYKIVTTDTLSLDEPFMTSVVNYDDKTIFRRSYKTKEEAQRGHSETCQDVKKDPEKYWLFGYNGESLDLRDIYPD